MGTLIKKDIKIIVEFTNDNDDAFRMNRIFSFMYALFNRYTRKVESDSDMTAELALLGVNNISEFREMKKFVDKMYNYF